MLARRLPVEAGIHPFLMPEPAEKLPLHSLLSLPRMSVKMLLRPKKLRKYQEMELTLQGQDGGGGQGVCTDTFVCSAPSQVAANLPGCTQAGQLDAPLQHRFELQGQRERHFG